MWEIILCNCGFDVGICFDGQEALERAERVASTSCLTDLAMPRTGGIETELRGFSLDGPSRSDVDQPAGDNRNSVLSSSELSRPPRALHDPGTRSGITCGHVDFHSAAQGTFRVSVLLRVSALYDRRGSSSALPGPAAFIERPGRRHYDHQSAGRSTCPPCRPRVAEFWNCTGAALLHHVLSHVQRKGHRRRRVRPLNNNRRIAIIGLVPRSLDDPQCAPDCRVTHRNRKQPKVGECSGIGPDNPIEAHVGSGQTA
jgi:hypothetical protein